MKRRKWLHNLLLGLAPAAALVRAQTEPAPPNHNERLPNGKNQQDEILKAEYQKSLKDAGQLLDLAEQLKAELEKNDAHVLSLSTLKKTDEIEKLAKRIRSRLRRF